MCVGLLEVEYGSSTISSMVDKAIIGVGVSILIEQKEIGPFGLNGVPFPLYIFTLALDQSAIVANWIVSGVKSVVCSRPCLRAGLHLTRCAPSCVSSCSERMRGACATCATLLLCCLYLSSLCQAGPSVTPGPMHVCGTLQESNSSI